MNREHYQLKDSRKMRENMNIDRGERQDSHVFWGVFIACMILFGYLAVADERFQDVPVKVAK